MDILCVSETWLNSNMPDRFIYIEGFNIFRTDNGCGSGTCIYVRNNLSCTRLDFDFPPCEGVEDTWVQVQCRKLPSIIVGVIYRHPKGTVETFHHISTIFHKASLKGKSLFVMGDLNDDLLCKNAKMHRILYVGGLKQVVDRPTRVTSTSKTLLDVLITNNEDMVLSCDVLNAHISDHDIVKAKLNLRKPKREPVIKTFRSLRNYSKETFCRFLFSRVRTLNNILFTDDVNRQTDILAEVFNECLDSCAPIVTKEITRPPAQWMTHEILETIEKRDQSRIIRDRNFTELSINRYKVLKNKVKQLINNAKVNHFNRKFIANKGIKRNIWDVIHEIIPSKQKDKQDCCFVNIEKRAEDFNEFFSSVGENVFRETQQYCEREELNVNRREGGEGQPLPNAEPNDPVFVPRRRFRPQPVNCDQIVLTVNDMKNKQSHGNDGITTRFLKDSLSVLTFYITIIVNTSIVTGKIPKKWKHAIVCPLYKKGDTDDRSNFRPISLLPVLSKVLEKVVSTQTYDFMFENNLFSKTHHGFLKHLSTETALNVIMEEMLEHIDQNEINLLTLCDLSKAFDSVSHAILLEKLDSLDIDTFWFENYLCERTQSVKINNHISEPKSIAYGVPQGSILGPLLFNIYVNDLKSNLEDCFLVQYADDSQFLISGKAEEIIDIVETCENKLNIVMHYFAENGLKLNGEKTQFLFTGSRQNISKIPDDICIQVGSSQVKPSTTVKNLGVILDQFLSFDDHIRGMCSKANGILYFLNRNKEYLNKESRKVVVESLINSIFNYCSTVWSVCGKTSLSKLQKIQNFAAKVATGKGRKYDHATPLINELGWLKLEDKVVYDLCIYVFNIINEETPNWVTDFRKVSDHINRQTRQSNDLLVPRKRTKIADRANSVRGAKQWNELPAEIRNTNVKSKFKKGLFAHIKENSNHY